MEIVNVVVAGIASFMFGRSGILLCPSHGSTHPG